MRKERKDKGKTHKPGAGRKADPSLKEGEVYLSRKASWKRRQASGVYYLSVDDQELATQAGVKLNLEGRSEIVRASLRHVVESL